MHAFSIDLILHSSDLVEHDCSLATIHDESEPCEDDSTEDEPSSDLSKSVEKPFHHIYLGIPFSKILIINLKCIINEKTPPLFLIIKAEIKV
jgi:hypothetical protein